MTDYSKYLLVAVLLVAFIAGYSVVSYVVRKLQVRHLDAARGDQNQKGSDAINDNRGQQEDPFRESDKT